MLIKSLRHLRGWRYDRRAIGVFEAAGLTQVEMVTRLDETRSYVSKCEREDRRVDVVQLPQYCRAKGINLVEFVAEFERQTGNGKRLLFRATARQGIAKSADKKRCKQSRDVSQRTAFRISRQPRGEDAPASFMNMIGNCAEKRGGNHVGVKLEVPVIVLDCKSVIEIPLRPQEVELGRAESAAMVQRVDEQPTKGAGDAGGKRRQVPSTRILQLADRPAAKPSSSQRSSARSSLRERHKARQNEGDQQSNVSVERRQNGLRAPRDRYYFTKLMEMVLSKTSYS